MAIFTPGPTIGTISGNLGAVNFCRSHAGPVVRRRLSKVKQQTPAQLEQRALFQQVHHDWLDLTDADRLAWSAAAREHPSRNRLGISRVKSGWQLFMSVMMSKGVAVLEQWTLPPTMRKSYPIYDIAVTVAGGPAYTVEWEPDTNILTKTAVCFGARPMKSHELRHVPSWKFLGLRNPAADAWDVYSIFAAKFGAPSAGEVCYIKIGVWTFDFLPPRLIPVAFSV